jgi:hypothetical protein
LTFAVFDDFADLFAFVAFALVGDRVCCSVVIDVNIRHTAIEVMQMPVLLLCSCCGCR